MEMDKRPPHVVSKRETWEFLVSKPELIEAAITLGVAQGSTLRRIARNFGIEYAWLYTYVNEDPALLRKYELALATRKDYMHDFLHDQFETLANADLRKLFDPNGGLLPVEKWPDDVAQFVSSIEVDELYEGTGKGRQQIGWTKKVKLWDKLKALEQLAKHFEFSGLDKEELAGKLTWEAIILMQIKREGEERAAKEVGKSEGNKPEHPDRNESRPLALPGRGHSDGDS